MIEEVFNVNKAIVLMSCSTIRSSFCMKAVAVHCGGSVYCIA